MAVVCVDALNGWEPGYFRLHWRAAGKEGEEQEEAVLPAEDLCWTCGGRRHSSGKCAGEGKVRCDYCGMGHAVRVCLDALNGWVAGTYQRWVEALEKEERGVEGARVEDQGAPGWREAMVTVPPEQCCLCGEARHRDDYCKRAEEGWVECSYCG